MQPMAQPQPAPTAPTTPKTPAEEGFLILNPPLKLYQPSGAHDVIRGYLLSRQDDGDGGAFYCLQLTTARAQGGTTIEAGKVMAVAEQPCIRALSYLMPKTEPIPPSGELSIKSVYEVILEPLQLQGDQWLCLIHGRHLLAQAAVPPVLRPPPFAILDRAADSDPPSEPDSGSDSAQS